MFIWSWWTQTNILHYTGADHIISDIRFSSADWVWRTSIRSDVTHDDSSADYSLINMINHCSEQSVIHFTSPFTSGKLKLNSLEGSEGSCRHTSDKSQHEIKIELIWFLIACHWTYCERWFCLHLHIKSYIGPLMFNQNVITCSSCDWAGHGQIRLCRRHTTHTICLCHIWAALDFLCSGCIARFKRENCCFTKIH